jgi:hypothetical protein
MNKTNESGYRVVYGEKKCGLIFVSLPAKSPNEALRQHGPMNCLLGIGVVYSNTMEGALKQARNCVFKL